METVCTNLLQDNQDMVMDNMAEEEEEEAAGVSHTPHGLHIMDLPDSIIFQICTYLPFSSISAIAQVCCRFSRISSDELLWRHIFLQHYKLPANTGMPAKAKSWRQEFKRLYYHTPAVLSEERKEHKDEVLHVSFSHDGTMFATCSKDGFFKVWECTHPVRLLFKMDMKSTFSWKFTQFSQFNETDTCLLVSGVYFGRLSTSGEIAVFNLQDDFKMQCRVTNKPYDVFGAWYDNDHLLSGTLYWTGDFNSVSAVWLSKASQEVESEVESVSMVLYRFENVNSSSIRLLHVAEVDKDSDSSESVADKGDLDASESAHTSPLSSSLDFGDEGKISMDFDTSRSLFEVEDSSQCHEAMPIEEVCILDRMLQKYIAEDEFDLENEDKTDNDGEGEDFHIEPDACKTDDLIDDVSRPGASRDLRPDKVREMTEIEPCLSEVIFNLNGRSGTEQANSGHGDGEYESFLPPQKLVPVQADDVPADCLGGAGCTELWSLDRPESSDIEPDIAQVCAAGTQLGDRISQSLKSCECSSGFTSSEKHIRSSVSTEASGSSVPQHIAMSEGHMSTLSSSSSSFTSSSVSGHAESVDYLSVPFSTATLKNPFVRSSNNTENGAKNPAQELGSAKAGLDASLARTSKLQLLEFLADRADLGIRNASGVRNCDEDNFRDFGISDVAREMNADVVPENANDVLTDHNNIVEDFPFGVLGGVPEMFSVADGALSATNMASEDMCEGASASASIDECYQHNLDVPVTREMSDMGNGSEGASESINVTLDGASVLENKPGARDVSQQFGLGFGSRDVSPPNVPSMFDNNLVMLIPGASHVYGTRNCGSAAHSSSINSSCNVSNNNASNNTETSSGLKHDTITLDTLVVESGTSQRHKSSIATQTEVASSRASSFHSLSHMSQSSSISRDFHFSPPREKLLIYTWGSETYIPHKVGIKRMKWTDFTRGEVTARRSSMLLPDVMENLHNMAGNRRDKPDVTIEMHGHIVGLSLSPDHKYLYVNCRPWPKNYIISDPQESPPLAQEVEISTIDLTTFNFVGPVLRSHKAYTHSDECFFLNLDVSDDYVASGAEDRQGYLWDRHYGIPLYRFPHRDVVNCVAINPQDSEILVTVSDDYTFKVWMSRSRAAELTGSNDANKGTSV